MLWQDCGKEERRRGDGGERPGRRCNERRRGARGDEVRRAAAGCGSARWSLAPWEGAGGGRRSKGEGWRKNGRPLAERRIEVCSHPPNNRYSIGSTHGMAGACGAGKLTRENRTTAPVAEKQGVHAQAFGPAFFYAPGKCLSCFSGCLSFEQACLFTPFSKRMEVGQQIVCFRWFHSVRRVKGRASGIHRLRFTPFRRRKLMCNAAAASHRRTSRMVPSCPLNTPLEGDGENEVALFSLP